MKVPEILVSGHHQDIKLWRSKKKLERTLERRNDLVSQENCQQFSQEKISQNYAKEDVQFCKDFGNGNYPDW